VGENIRVRQTIDDNIIYSMRIACRISKVTDTHTQNIECLSHFHGNIVDTNMPQSYVIRTLPLLSVLHVIYTHVGDLKYLLMSSISRSGQ
jgi:hypothetical protein